jgi:molybdopterin-binding protein
MKNICIIIMCCFGFAFIGNANDGDSACSEKSVKELKLQGTLQVKEVLKKDQKINIYILVTSDKKEIELPKNACGKIALDKFNGKEVIATVKATSKKEMGQDTITVKQVLKIKLKSGDDNADDDDDDADDDGGEE